MNTLKSDMTPLKPIFALFILFTTLVLPTSELLADQTAWFVSPEDGLGGDGSYNQPFHSIDEGLQNANPGDTVYLLPGEYELEQGLVIEKSGKENQWITLSNYKNQPVVLNGQNYFLDTDGSHLSTDHHAIVLIKNSSYFRFNGITVKNSHSQGIIVRGPGTATIEISNCKVENTFGSGIGIWYSDHTKVYGCDISGANRMEMATKGRKLGSEAPHEALTIAGATNFEIFRNEVHHCDKEGIDVKEVSQNGKVHHNVVHHVKRQALYVDAWFGELKNIELYENEAYENEWGFVISVEGENSVVDGVNFHHNLIRDNRGSGIYFGIWGKNLIRKNIEISNNTVVRNGSPKHWSAPTGGIDLRSPNFQDVLVKNNISIENYGFDLAIAMPYTADNLLEKNLILENNWVGKNLVVNESSTYGPLFPVNESVVTTQIFKDFNANDFHIVLQQVPEKLRQNTIPGYK